MTRPDPHEAYEALAAGHALHALEPEEEQVFLEHLSGCSRCERDLADHRATLAHVAYAPDAAEPPLGLLDGIRSGVAASDRQASHPVPASLGAARQRRSHRLGSTWGQAAAVAAAAALVLGLGGWNVALRADRAEQQAWSERITAAVREIGVEGTDTVPLRSRDQVVAVALVHDDEMTLLVDGLETNDTSSSTYVLWGQSRFGDVRPVGAFDVTETGLDARPGLRLQAGVSDVTRFMVTAEPGRAAPPIPTLPVLAAGDV